MHPQDDPSHKAHGFDLRSLLHILLEKAWLIALVFVVTVFLTGAYLMRAPHVYAANALIEVQQEEEKVVNIQKVQAEDLRSLDTLRTIEQTLESRSLFERVVDTNNLVNDPRFLNPETGARPTREQLVGMLGNMVSARLRRGTRLIDITVSHTDPKLTKVVANSLVREFMSMDLDQYEASSQMANDFLMDEAQRLKRKLQESENALQAYKESTKSVSLEERQNIVVQRLKELSVKVTEAKSQRLKAESDYAQVNELGTNIQALLVIPAVANDPAVGAILLNLSKMEADFATLKQRYRPKHPDYIKAQSEIAEWKAALREAVLKVPQTLRAALDGARAGEASLETAQREQETAALALNKAAIQYNVLSREVESDRALYDAVLQRMKETTLTKGLPQTKIRVREWAYIPKTPVSPNKKTILTQGIAGGLVLGVLLALLLNSLDTSIKTVDQAEESLGLPVLSVVPHVKEAGKVQVLSLGDAKSQGAEAFRSLRTSLSMLGREENRRVFLLTSALPQEGKTFCSVNCAASFAHSGLRTVIIDGDLRRPAVEEALGRSNKKTTGVTDFLAGKATFAELVQPAGPENLSYVGAGSVAPNPAELLAQTGFEGLIDEALLQFDRVVIDSAPLHAVSDTLMMLSRVQTVCLVARACKTPRKSVMRAVQMLQKAEAPLAGLILNRMPRRRGLEYYYDAYYDYSYRGKYAQKGVYGST